MTDPTPICDLIPEALELIGSERDMPDEFDEWADVLNDDDEPEDDTMFYDPFTMS